MTGLAGQTLRVDVDDHKRRIIASPPAALSLDFKALPCSRFDVTRWTYPATTVMAERVAEQARAAKSLGVVPTMSPAFARLLAAAERARAAEPLRDADPGDFDAIPGRTDAWPHQRQAYHWALERAGGPGALGRGEWGSGSMLNLDMGTGKTRVVLGLLEGMDAGVALVMCPLSVVGVWPREVRRHSTRDRWRVWAGEGRGASGRALKNPTVSQRALTLERELDRALTASEPILLIVHYDVVWRKEIANLLLGIARRRQLQGLCLDESHRAKGAGAKSSQFSARLRAYLDSPLLATGTAMAHSPLDVFGQYRTLDPGVYGSNHADFRAKFAVEAPTPTGKGKMIVGVNRGAAAELSRLFHAEAIVRKSDDVLTGKLALPGRVPPARRYFDLDPAARRAYEQLDGDFVAAVAGGRVTAANAMVKILRLQQIACGHVPTARPCPACQPADIPWTPTASDALDRLLADAGDAADGPLIDAMALGELEAERRRHAVGCKACGGTAMKVTVDAVDSGRGRLLAEILDDAGPDPAVVFCRFRWDLDVIAGAARELGRTCGELSGRRRDGLTADGEMADVDVLAAQIQSGGVGIDLTRSALAVYYSVGTSLSDKQQSIKRQDRPGQTRKVREVHLLARGTVDERVFGALEANESIVEWVMRIARPGVDWGG